MPEKFDFGGYATRYGVKCSDGRTIKAGAFKHADGVKTPLVWEHLREGPENILGHVMLTHRDDGVYALAKFNETENGKTAKTLVDSGDVESLSIYANKLVEEEKLVQSGVIREVSLVISGANPGARIDNLSFEHGDGESDIIKEDAIIYTDTSIVYGDDLEHADDDGKTVEDVMNTLNEDQVTAVYAVISALIDGKEDLKQSSHDEGKGKGFIMKKNIFDASKTEKEGATLSHSVGATILADARRAGSLKEAVLRHTESLSENERQEVENFLAHAGTYGIDNIGNLFPDNKTVGEFPYMITRDMGWVGKWKAGVHKTPFSRIKTTYVDLTEDAARAKGYVTAALKVDQVFAALKRTTDPTTIYKKQKLDRDDVLDITDFNVVAFLKKEMRFMLDEELGRACLVGDGRAVDDDDKVAEANIRPVYGDSSVYSHLVTLEDTVTDYADIIDDIILNRKFYKGSGSPDLYISGEHLTGMLILKDTTGRRLYKTIQELAGELRVNSIVETEIFEGVEREEGEDYVADLICMLINPRDYSIGADKGGQINMFDDFDIDYNQYKYLIETRVSGALTKPKAALCIERKQAAE